MLTWNIKRDSSGEDRKISDTTSFVTLYLFAIFFKIVNFQSSVLRNWLDDVEKDLRKILL
jgi:hypothetical protein